MPEIVIKSWTDMTADEFFNIARLRADVFYLEQRVDEPDLDEIDRDSRTLHCWVSDASGCAAYLRIIELNQPEYGARHSFGRVAVRADRRGEGLARRLILTVVERYRTEAIVIHAQEYVAGLYAEYGFEVIGERYFEAGLAHLPMLRAAEK